MTIFTSDAAVLFNYLGVAAGVYEVFGFTLVLSGYRNLFLLNLGVIFSPTILLGNMV